MIDRAVRPFKTRALAPLSYALRRVAPGTLTASGLVAGLTAATAAALGLSWLALGLWLLNRLLDGLDGDVARIAVDGETRQSDRGGYLDLMADLTVYAAVSVGVAAGATGALGAEPLAAPVPTWALAAVLLATYYVNLGSLTVLSSLLEKRRLGARERRDSTSVAMPAGLIEGAETIVLISLMIVAPHFLPLLFGVGAALVGLTALQRIAWTARLLRDAP